MQGPSSKTTTQAAWAVCEEGTQQNLLSRGFLFLYLQPK